VEKLREPSVQLVVNKVGELLVEAQSAVRIPEINPYARLQEVIRENACFRESLWQWQW
jgi:hypothetical protein